MTSAPVPLPSRLPDQGELVLLRSRRWLVEEVVPSPEPGQSAIVRLACADDDAQGQTLDVFWSHEPDRMILTEEGWGSLAGQGFDQPQVFAAFLHTLRWNCVTATDPGLFQSPFRAGIKIDAYQMGARQESEKPPAQPVDRRARRSQKSSKRLLSLEQRRAMMALAPSTVQNIPPCFRRMPMARLQPDSTTAEDVHRPAAWNWS